MNSDDNKNTVSRTPKENVNVDMNLSAKQLIQKYDCVSLDTFDNMLEYEIVHQFEDIE